VSDSETLGPYFEAFIREQIDSGRYNNSGEVIRAALRALEERELIQKFEDIKTELREKMDCWE